MRCPLFQLRLASKLARLRIFLPMGRRFGGEAFGLPPLFVFEGAAVAITDWEMADLVREVCLDAGTGPLVLGGALPGYRGFAAALSVGATFPYVIQGVFDPAQWEAGSGTIDGGGRLVRVPHASSADGAPVDFVAGEKHVGLALHADWVARVEGHGHGIEAIEGLAAAIAAGPAGGALTRVDDANVRLTLGGGAATALLRPASISVGWSGQLAVVRGGTGAASLTGYVKGNGAAAMSASATIPASDISGLGSMAAQQAGAVAIGGGTAVLSAFSLTPASGAASAVVSAVNGQSAALSLGTGGVEMWRVERTASANSGANAGSDFAVRRMDDGGVVLGTAIAISRASGAISCSASSAPVLSAARTGSNFNCCFAAQTSAGTLYFGNADGTRFAIGPNSNLAVSPYLTASATSFAIGASVETSFASVGRPLTDNGLAWGTAAYRWSTIYAASGTINTSDARAKCDIGAADAALIDAWGAVTWQRYRFIEAVAEKGEDARWHMGLVAQQVRDAIDQQLGAGAAVRWGLVCHDGWEAVPAQDGVPARAAGDRWGLRYDECFALEAVWQRRAIARLEARLALLEGASDDAGG